MIASDGFFVGWCCGLHITVRSGVLVGNDTRRRLRDNTEWSSGVGSLLTLSMLFPENDEDVFLRAASVHVSGDDTIAASNTYGDGAESEEDIVEVL
jgi:hypothetical protein